jgi:hypothetical protein
LDRYDFPVRNHDLGADGTIGADAYVRRVRTSCSDNGRDWRVLGGVDIERPTSGKVSCPADLKAADGLGRPVAAGAAHGVHGNQRGDGNPNNGLAFS